MLAASLIEEIKSAIGVKQLDGTGKGGGGGCINQGQVYNTDKGKMFLKQNDKDGAEMMFRGELASLEAIRNTGTITVPEPHAVVMGGTKSNKRVGVLVLQYLDLQGGGGNGALGYKLAELHLHNAGQGSSAASSRVTRSSSHDSNNLAGYVAQFGFDMPTCCGYLPQCNDWSDDWQVFYSRKLDEQINRLEKKGGSSNREAVQLWPLVQRAIPGLFQHLHSPPTPALLHGDLWGGNVARIHGEQGSYPVIFDPASFYGHHEYDLALATMFGGFSKSFWDAYFEKIPKETGWEERHQLYQLFHYLNHWNHFGSGYSSSSLDIMRTLVN